MGADCRREITSSLNCSSSPEKPLLTLYSSYAPMHLLKSSELSNRSKLFLLSALVSMTGTITAECKRLACFSSKKDEQSLPLGWWRQGNQDPLLEKLSQLQVGILLVTATKQCSCLCKADYKVTQTRLSKQDLVQAEPSCSRHLAFLNDSGVGKLQIALGIESKI